MYKVKQTNRKYMQRHQRGFVLILALVLLAVLTLIGVASMNSANMELRATANARQHLIAFNSGQSLLEYTLSTGALRDDGEVINYQTTAAVAQGVGHPVNNNTSQASVAFVGCSFAPGSSLEEGKGFSYNFFGVEVTGANSNSGAAVSRLNQGVRFPAAACPL